MEDSRLKVTGKLSSEGVLLLRGLDSRLSKDPPSDLQKLRCQVAFHALRFAPPILELGNKGCGTKDPILLSI
ncbi:hypothetical protein EZV62_026079 [Acer yangbiense]|uniref:O-fucosyltransferase family protein n=1 Tax=Acer yangbiense TaxID=1000413 RepID=A0A5C7GQG5_9ROSI|nr:hypothetical protein EZV62_026079 [Acer yangbiense]